ncbi:hypothetical protein K1719_032565 [Acacia pycnantha]|nr:hypothetical protein K1719_032565 [Acacia pycnantha]
MNDGFGNFSYYYVRKDFSLARFARVKPEVLNWSPRIILLHNFLSVEECDYLRAIALPRLQVSTVVDAKTGKGIGSDVGTSSGMFRVLKRKYPMIQNLKIKINHPRFLNIGNQESMNSELPACLMKKVDSVPSGANANPLKSDIVFI